MRHYNCRPPVFPHVKTPTPRPKFSADRKAFNAFFSATKRLFDGLNEEQLTILRSAIPPDELKKFSDAFEVASDIFFDRQPTPPAP